MAARTPAFAPLASNLAVASATVITASSAQAALPTSYLYDALPSKRWRSVLGWNVVAGFNDKLDFTEAGVARVATLTAGNYATGALYAAQAQAAMNAAPGATNTYTVTYDVATFKPTIARATGANALALPFATGANVATSAHRDLGFASTDKSGSTSYLADGATYHSREYLAFDLGSAQAVTLGIAHGHNAGSGGTFTLYGKASASPWSSPATTQALAGDDLSNKRLLLFGSQTYRYWALVIDDVANADGFSEVGVPFIGTYWTPGRGYNMGATRQAVALSTLTQAVEGALFVTQRNSPKTHQVRYHALSRSDLATYQAIEDAHTHVFFLKDPGNYPGLETVYGVITSVATVTEISGPGGLFDIDVSMAENLG